jgi:hypothetical protein
MLTVEALVHIHAELYLKHRNTSIFLKSFRIPSPQLLYLFFRKTYDPLWKTRCRVQTRNSRVQMDDINMFDIAETNTQNVVFLNKTICRCLVFLSMDKVPIFY